MKSEDCEELKLGASRHIKGGGERLPCSALIFPNPLNCKGMTGKKPALYSLILRVQGLFFCFGFFLEKRFLKGSNRTFIWL